MLPYWAKLNIWLVSAELLLGVPPFTCPPPVFYWNSDNSLFKQGTPLGARDASDVGENHFDLSFPCEGVFSLLRYKGYIQSSTVLLLFVSSSATSTLSRKRGYSGASAFLHFLLCLLIPWGTKTLFLKETGVC